MSFHNIQISNIYFEFSKKNLMDFTKQVTNWVERKFGKIIGNDLKQKIQKEDSPFDLKGYANDFFEIYFEKNEIDLIKKNIIKEQFQCYFSHSKLKLPKKVYTCNLSSSESSLNSLEFENDLNNFSLEDLISGLSDSSKEVQINFLRVLEASADEIINQTSWNVIKKILQHLLLDMKEDQKIQNLVLQVFQKLMSCPVKPQIVCEAFISLTKVVSFYIKLICLNNDHINDQNEQKCSCQTPLQLSQAQSIWKEKTIIDVKLMLKSMRLLIECQKQMPEKWIRFNEKRLREIIFSFIHLLATTNTKENYKLTGLELLSILNPTATWCQHWCHTAIGRSLLYSAFRKYKTFFIHIVEIILFNVKSKKLDDNVTQNLDKGKVLYESRSNGSIKSEYCKLTQESNIENLCLENVRTKEIFSAPPLCEKEKSLKKNKINEIRKCSLKNFFDYIPPKIINQAVFCHCMSVVLCLIQFRSGQSLFPIKTLTKKRLINVQDLIISMSDYLENREYSECNRKGISFTHKYRRNILEMIKILKNVRESINSSRMNTDRLPSRISISLSYLNF